MNLEERKKKKTGRWFSEGGISISGEKSTIYRAGCPKYDFSLGPDLGLGLDNSDYMCWGVWRFGASDGQYCCLNKTELTYYTL